MARPIKNNADYFSHDNDMRDDERIKAVRRKFSHLGYSTWNMLLERLCRAENFRIVYNEETLDLMAGDFNIEPDQLKVIIDYLIKLKLITHEQEHIFSKTMITRFEGLFRKRQRDTERLSVAKTTTPNIIADDNTQSKVKESKENKSKEKGIGEISSPDFSNHFSFSENKNLVSDLSSNVEVPESNSLKKSCAKKSLSNELIQACTQSFETFAPQYVWETKDHEQLVALLQKISITKPDLKGDIELANAFTNFIQTLPEYWKTKKFTIPNLNYNYNEIVSEMRAGKASKPVKKTTPSKPLHTPHLETKRELSEAEKMEQRKSFIRSICECYEKFVDTGQQGFLPLWVMYDTLVEERALTLSKPKLEAYKNQAIAERKAELHKPKHQHEARIFNSILENFDNEITHGNEKHKLDIAVKILAVKGLFEELKHKKIDIKKLFKH